MHVDLDYLIYYIFTMFPSSLLLWQLLKRGNTGQNLNFAG